MLDTIGNKNSVTVKKVKRLLDEGERKPRQQAVLGKPDSEEEKRRLGANIDERC
ncbi:MAG: hypothetical protein ACI9DH_001121 [Halioglobus sp.]|jgi:hypothetical protein